jgi:hypothetical protein
MRRVPWQGVDAYTPHACNVDNFNIPPTWLWLGVLGLDGSDSTWFAVVIIVITATVMVLLYRGSSWSHGLIGLAAIASPSAMMGVERGNLDLAGRAASGGPLTKTRGRREAAMPPTTASP